MRRVSYRYTKKNQRRDRRFEQPLLAVEIDGQSYPAGDWSLGGVRIIGLLPGGMEGASTVLKFSGVRNGRLHAGEITADIVRVSINNAETALSFNRFHGSAFDALEGLITGRRPPEGEPVWQSQDTVDSAIAPTSP